MELLQGLGAAGLRHDLGLAAFGLGLLGLGLLLLRLLAPRGRSIPLFAASMLALGFALCLVLRSLIPWPGGSAFLGACATLFLSLALARLLFLLAFDALLWRGREDAPPKILRDLGQGALFFLAVLVSLRWFGVEAGQLLTTSALISVVAGLALQETLGNLLAGLALQGDRPFEEGDWIEIHGASPVSGRVREITWRATRLQTLDNVDVSVPNGQLAKATITNYVRPHRVPRRSVYFHVPYAVAPREVHEVVLPAVRGADGVLAEPAPSLVTHGFDEAGVHYWLRYHISDVGRRDLIDGGVRDRVWYALGRAGLPLAVPSRTLHLHEVSEASERARAESELAARTTALRGIDLFEPLSAAEQARLAERARLVRYAPLEVVIRRGERGDTMFLVKSGQLRVLVDAGGQEVEAARLGPEAFFGEMSLLTGEPRQATVQALESCELLVLEHAAFAELLEKHPEVAAQVSAKLVERRLRNQDVQRTPELAAKVERESSDLLQRIRGFFGLAKGTG